MFSPTGELVAAAQRTGGGVGAFNVITLEHAEAIVAGAEAAGRPVILQISENAVRFHFGRLGPIAAAAVSVAWMLPFAGQTLYAVAYKTGSPDVAGTTVNTLAGM